MPKEPLIEQLYKGKENLSYPTAIISGSGEAWFLNPETRSMERVYRGTIVKQVSTDVDHKGRHLVKLMAIYILVPEEELFSVGDN
jgi:hypothetical protein